MKFSTIAAAVLLAAPFTIADSSSASTTSKRAAVTPSPNPSQIISSIFPKGVDGVPASVLTYIVTAVQGIDANPTFASANAFLITAVPQTYAPPTGAYTAEPWYTGLPEDVKSAFNAEVSAISSVAAAAISMTPAKPNGAIPNVYIGLPTAIVGASALLGAMLLL